MDNLNHHFAVVLAADVACFSKLMEDDGEATVGALKDCRSVFRRCVVAHFGREFGSVGDSLMAEFASPVEALRAARDIQTQLGSEKNQKDDCEHMQMRIGLHAGDVISDDKDLFGDVVNTAARLQRIAKAGGIALSELVYQQVHKEAGYEFRPLGQQQLKNIAEPMRVYEVARQHHALNWRRARLLFAPYKVALAGVIGILASAALIMGYLESSQLGLGRIVEVPAGPLQSRAPPPANSIAVLPFVNFSNEDDFFTDGLTDAIRNQLANSPELKVIGRTSSFKFKGKNEDLSVIRDSLNVKYVVEGSVRRSGNKLRVMAQLTYTEDGYNIWSHTYDRETADVFVLQDELAAAIGRALNLRLVPRAKQLTENYDAYVLYLEALAYSTSAPGENWADKAVALLDRSIELDPQFAAAYELKAVTYWGVESDGYDLKRTRRLCFEAATAALKIEPNLAGAHAYAVACDPVNWSWLKEIEALETLVAVQPRNILAMDALTYDLIAMGYASQAQGYIHKMLEQEPMAAWLHWRYGNVLMIAGNHSDAIKEWSSMAKSKTGHRRSSSMLLWVQLLLGEDEAAIQFYNNHILAKDLASGDWPEDIGEFIHRVRGEATGKAYLQSWIDEVGRSQDKAVGPVALLIPFGYLDEFWHAAPNVSQSDAGYVEFGRHVRKGSIFREFGFTRHPEYIQYAKATGMTDVWDKRGPPDYCHKPDGEWVCS